MQATTVDQLNEQLKKAAPKIQEEARRRQARMLRAGESIITREEMLRFMPPDLRFHTGGPLSGHRNHEHVHIAFSHNDMEGEDVGNTEERRKLRTDIAEELRTATSGKEEVAGVLKVTEETGPRGGKQAKFVAAVEQEDGSIASVLVVVYSDDNTDRLLEEEIERQREAKEKAERIRDGLSDLS